MENFGNFNSFFNNVDQIFNEIVQSLYTLINKIFETQLLGNFIQILKAFGTIAIGVLETLVRILKMIVK